jgi:hypothetical protein
MIQQAEYNYIRYLKGKKQSLQVWYHNDGAFDSTSMSILSRIMRGFQPLLHGRLLELLGPLLS